MAGGGEREGAQAMDSGEKRLNELGYKQELRREMVLLPSGSYLYAISRPLPLSLFSCSSS
jgi:hypothetical protein